jgi:thioesterase domain-containing protein
MAHQLRRDGEEVALVFMLDPSGIERRLPGVEPKQLRQHLRQLAALGLRQKLDYLLPRAKGRVMDAAAARTNRMSRRLRRLRWNVCVLSGRLLPPSLRSPYIIDVYQRALHSYVPQEYSGRVMIFKSDQICYQPPMDWVELTRGPLEVYEEPCRHTDLNKTANVGMWATRLRDALDRVG